MNRNNYINGHDFLSALVSGITNIISQHEHLNKINVFPVPDVDTGTNLLFTPKPIIKIDKEIIDPNFETTLDLIANTAIESARGNSGTIIAQYFIGMLESCDNFDTLNIDNIAHLFSGGYNAASNAMSDPKEGTIITVMKDVAMYLESKELNSNTTILDIFIEILDVAKTSLIKTPQLMKVLKDAGVVDAGAEGYVNLIEGIVYYLKNNKIMNENIASNLKLEEVTSIDNVEKYDKSEFQFCTECIIENNNLDRKEIRNELSIMGDSFIVAGNKSKVKIHIHTNNPNKVFQICESFGSIKNEKADDMHAQIKTINNNKSKIAIVTDSGCDIAIDSHNSNIHMIPVRYSFGEKEYIDKISQNAQEFYNELETNPIHPKTSQPPTGDFINKFDYLSSHFESIISLHIPDKLSGTLDSCKNAIKKFENIKISAVDSLSASTGLGLIVQSASELSETITNHDELLEKINLLIKNTKIYLGIQDINYAIKGGRVPKIKGLISQALNLRPILSTDVEGKLKAKSVIFGKKKFHLKVATFVINQIKDNGNYKFSISHSNAENEGYEIVDFIENNFKNVVSIDLVDLGSALGVHAGPGSFGIGVQKIVDG